MKRLVLGTLVLLIALSMPALGQAAAPATPGAPAPRQLPSAQTSPSFTPSAQDTTAKIAPSTQPVTSPLLAVPTVVQSDTTGHQTTNVLLPHDLSPWSMFMSATIVVKAVMVGLAFASLMTWTIFLAKTFEFAVAKGRLRRGLQRFEAAKTFAEARVALGKKDRVLKTFLAVVDRELAWSDRGVRDSLKARCESEITELARTEVQSMRRGMPLLATVGSTAPFVGLFGTVWGIMNAFIGISKSQTTNLAVVAPGIAEALLATAIGLVAAIPAVIIYNHFSQAGRRYQFLVNRAAGAVQRTVSRELDRRPTGAALEAAE